MADYDISVDGKTYRVHSDSPLSDKELQDVAAQYAGSGPFAGARASATGAGGLTPDQINRAVQGSGHKEIVDDRRPGEAPIGYKSGPIKMTPALRAKLRQNRGDQPESGSILGKYEKPSTGNEVQDTINQAQASGQAFGEFAAPVANILARLAPTYGLNPKAHEAAAQSVVGGLINTPFNFGADLQIATDLANKATPLQRLGAGANILAQTPVAEMVASPILKIAGKAIGRGMEAIKGTKPPTVVPPLEVVQGGQDLPGVNFRPNTNKGGVTQGARIGAANSTGHITTADTLAADLQASIEQIAQKKAGRPPEPKIGDTVYVNGDIRVGKAFSPDDPTGVAPYVYKGEAPGFPGRYLLESRDGDKIAVIRHEFGINQSERPPLHPVGLGPVETSPVETTPVASKGNPAVSDPFAALAEPTKVRTAADAMADFQRLVKEGKDSGSLGAMGGEKISKYIEAGGYLLEAGVKTAKEWGEHMVTHFGEEVRPHLQAVWDHIQQGFDKNDPFTQMPKGKPTAEDISKAALDYHRFNLLSGPGIIGKMGTSVAQNAVTTPIEDLIGAGIGKLAPKLAAKAPWEAAGAGGVKTSVQSLGDLFSKSPEFTKGSFADALDMLKTGKNELGGKFGETFAGQEFNPGLSPRDKVLGFWGRLHGAAMTPLQRTAYIRSLANRTAALGSGATEEELTNAAKGAFGDSLQSIFRNDNVATKAFTDALNSGMSPTGANVARNLVPFAGVGSNVAGRMAEYTPVGSIYQGLKTLFRGGIDRLTPEEAAAVMRAYKRGGVGAGLFGLGYMAPDMINKLPSAIKHNPAVQVAVMGATIAKSKNAGEAASKIVSQVSRDLPMISGPQNALTIASPDPRVSPEEKGKALAKELSGWFPQSGGVGYLARTIDKRGGPSVFGDTNKRTPKGFRDEFKSNIPWLREEVRHGGSPGTAVSPTKGIKRLSPPKLSLKRLNP